MNSVKVSIVTTTYNHEKYIEQALQSVADQKTNFEIEHLVGEDGSKDGTKDVCLQFAEKYKHVRVFQNDRSNVIYIKDRPTGRWNFVNLIRHATGEYIALLPGDDYWIDPYKLQKQIDFLDANEEYGLCYTDTNVIGISDQDVYSSKQDYSFSFSDSIIKKGGTTLTMVFRRSLIDLDYYVKSTMECVMGDWPLECLIMLNCKGHHMSDKTGVYRRHDKGITKRSLMRPFSFNDSRISFLSNLYESELLTNEKKTIVAWILCKNHYLRGALHFSKKNFKAFKTDLSKAWSFTFKASKPKTHDLWKYKKINIFRSVSKNYIRGLKNIITGK